MTSVRSRNLIGVAVSALALSIAFSASADQNAELRPPNFKPDLTSTEGGLWGASDKAEDYVRRSGELIKDPKLTGFVHDVVCRVASEYCSELRVYVLDRPFLNAAAAPNGYIEVNSGLLLRARTEAELAFVLGHEVSHYGRNHTLARWNKGKTTANVVLALQVGVAVGAAVAMHAAANTGSPSAGQAINSISDSARTLNDVLYLQGLASVFSYTREQESEADRLGYDRSVAAHYEKTASIGMWKSVKAETQASDFPKVRKSESRASIFDTHPITDERLKTLAGYAGTDVVAVDLTAEPQYRAVIRPYLGRWLKDDLRRRDFGQTLYLIDRMQAEGEDLGVLSFYRGEALRLRRADGDAPKTVAAYRDAVKYSDAPVAAWRELAECLRKAGDSTGAREAYGAYLTNAPNAEDRWIVEASLKSLK